MKTNFPQRFKKQQWLLRIVVVCGIFIILFFFSKFFGDGVSRVVSPLYSARVWFTHSQSVIPTFFRSRVELSREIEELRSKLAQTIDHTERFSVLEEENALLRGLQIDIYPDRIVADVVRRPSETPYDTILIHAGAVEGVKEGSLAYAGVAVVGVVGRVFEKSALVVLFSTAGVVSPTYIYGPNVFAHAEGMGGGVLRVSVPQGIKLSVGDSVVVPAKGSGVYGAIEYIESDESKPEQYAYVTQRPSVHELRFISIDKEPLPEISYDDARASIARASNTPLTHLAEQITASSSVSTTTIQSATSE